MLLIYLFSTEKETVPSFIVRIVSLKYLFAKNKDFFRLAKKRKKGWWIFKAFSTKLMIVLFQTVQRFEPPHDKTNKTICAHSENSDQPGHPPSLISVFAVRNKKHWILGYPLSALRRLWSDRPDAQTDLSLRWAHRSFCWFCHEAAHFCRKKNRSSRSRQNGVNPSAKKLHVVNSLVKSWYLQPFKLSGLH